MTDQQRADLAAREGFPLDTTPFVDSLAAGGTWFNRAYTTSPTCAPARVSMLTGRYPSATRVRTNHNLADATYSRDLVQVLKARGYATALCGKNHSHAGPNRWDHHFGLGHNAGFNQGPDRTEDEKAFDAWLQGLQHRAAMAPTPFPLECQGPVRAVADARNWVQGLDGKPFFLWLSFAEPHNPYQVPEPYFSMFPPESLPPPRATRDALPKKGFKWTWNRRMFKAAFPDFEEQVPRGRSNYLGMLRLIDDQVRRFVDYLDRTGLRDNTLLVFVADHGDFAGEYDLLRKGPEMPEFLMRVPLLFNGPGVRESGGAHPAHVSIADMMPTFCDMLDEPLPDGVQGRSLWPLLSGADYPEAEFASVYAEQGFGGLHYTADDDLDPAAEGALNPNCSFDCLNSWSQSGALRMVRKGDWKLIMDMQGRGQLYNVATDPAELEDLFGRADSAEVERELLIELLAWTIRAQDPLPLPHRRYVMKTDPRNYYAPYR